MCFSVENTSLFKAAFQTTGYITIPHDAVMVFDKELIDVGNNYNSSTGEYTAPVHGYYMFYVQLQGKHNRHGSNNIDYRIAVNGKIQQHSRESGSTAKGTFLLKLEIGDKVAIIHGPDVIITEFYGRTDDQLYSWFMGYLLYEE